MDQGEIPPHESQNLFCFEKTASNKKTTTLMRKNRFDTRSHKRLTPGIYSKYWQHTFNHILSPEWNGQKWLSDLSVRSPTVCQCGRLRAAMEETASPREDVVMRSQNFNLHLGLHWFYKHHWQGRFCPLGLSGHEWHLPCLSAPKAVTEEILVANLWEKVSGWILKMFSTQLKCFALKREGIPNISVL